MSTPFPDIVIDPDLRRRSRTGEVAFIAGVDEAGLGPLLGPLVIGYALVAAAPASAPDGGPDDAEDLWRRLRPLISSDPARRREQIVVCDSKKLYSPTRGVGALEESLLPLLQAALEGGGRKGKSLPRDFADFWETCALAPRRELLRYPWYREHTLALPRAGLMEKIEIRGRQAADQFAARGLALAGLGTLPVLEGEFNRLLGVHHNKADAHASAVMAVIGGLWRAAGTLTLRCDRLGARERYSEALRVHLKPDVIEVLEETPSRSRYRLERKGDDGPETLRISFSVGGDIEHFTTALASMAAKYTRELCMEVFNRSFAALVPGVKPTKGYVTDGRRFLIDTAAARRASALPDDLLIRRK